MKIILIIAFFIYCGVLIWMVREGLKGVKERFKVPKEELVKE